MYATRLHQQDRRRSLTLSAAQGHSQRGSTFITISPNPGTRTIILQQTNKMYTHYISNVFYQTHNVKDLRNISGVLYMQQLFLATQNTCLVCVLLCIIGQLSTAFQSKINLECNFFINFHTLTGSIGMNTAYTHTHDNHSRTHFAFSCLKWQLVAIDIIYCSPVTSCNWKVAKQQAIRCVRS